jgi:hypothetical protein
MENTQKENERAWRIRLIILPYALSTNRYKIVEPISETIRQEKLGPIQRKFIDVFFMIL